MQQLIEVLVISSALALGQSVETAGGKTVRKVVIVPIGAQDARGLEFLRGGVSQERCVPIAGWAHACVTGAGLH